MPDSSPLPFDWEGLFESIDEIADRLAEAPKPNVHVDLALTEALVKLQEARREVWRGQTLLIAGADEA